MRHIKEFELFETSEIDAKDPVSNEVWDPTEHPYYINSLPWMMKWLGGVETIYTGSPGHDDSKIIAPYGLEIEIRMDPDDGSAEYSGEGQWDIDSWGEDDWGIHYNLPGYITNVRDPDDLADGEWEWTEDIFATIGYPGFDPIKFLEKAILKEPIVASQLYEVLPKDKRREADELFNRLGIDIGKISKGSKLISGMES